MRLMALINAILIAVVILVILFPVTTRSKGRAKPIEYSFLDKSDKKVNKKVLILAIDGIRPDALKRSRTPHLDWLIDHAVYSMNAQIQRRGDSVSGPGWASVFTGVESTKHNIWRNKNYERIETAYPTFLKQLHRKKQRISFAASWKPLFTMFKVEQFDHWTRGKDKANAAWTVDVIENDKADASVLYFSGVDYAGHTTGFSPRNRIYRRAIEKVDRYVGHVLAAISKRPTIDSEDWLIVVVTDHGGRGHTHSGRHRKSTTIPLIFANTRRRGFIKSPANHLDVAPTVLKFMGIFNEKRSKHDGKVVELGG